LPEFLREHIQHTPLDKSDDQKAVIDGLLRKVFLDFDDKVRSPDAMKELRVLAGKGLCVFVVFYFSCCVLSSCEVVIVNDSCVLIFRMNNNISKQSITDDVAENGNHNDVDDDDAHPADLCNEAAMPLEEVLKTYGLALVRARRNKKGLFKCFGLLFLIY
jgi:hypothetical protein